MGTLITGLIFVIIGVLAFFVGKFFIESKLARVVPATILIVLGLILAVASTAVFIEKGQFGVVTQKWGGKPLPSKYIIAPSDEYNGVQAEFLTPGWHLWIPPWQYDINIDNEMVIPDGKVGYVTALDGEKLNNGQPFANAWESVNDMLEPAKFLADGGQKGPQMTVLTPGTYRIHPRLFKVEPGDVTEIAIGKVGVVKSNFGQKDCEVDEFSRVDEGCVGVLKDPLLPGRYYINRQASVVYPMETLKNKVAYVWKKEQQETTGQFEADYQYGAIDVKSLDGYKFPVDVRLVYHIEPNNATKVRATIGDDEGALMKLVNSAVRSTFRDAAEVSKALDYVKNRTKQQAHASKLIVESLAPHGITVDEVYMAEIAPDGSLDHLLKTQTDRELALQQEETYEYQRQAAIKKQAYQKELQRAEEEKKLATAEVGVKIAEKDKEQRIVAAEAFAQEKLIDAKAEAEKKLIAAEAEAERVRKVGLAQAEAYNAVVAALGKNNIANIKLLEIIRDGRVKITPDVQVGSGGTMVDALLGQMIAKQ